MLRLDRGALFMESIRRFAAEQDFGFATISGIGALREADLGYFVWDNKQYARRTLRGPFELVSVIGNVCRIDGEPFVHAHVALGDGDYRVWGGHLFEATVSLVAELQFSATDEPVGREVADFCGLPLLDLPDSGTPPAI